MQLLSSIELQGFRNASCTMGCHVHQTGVKLAVQGHIAPIGRLRKLTAVGDKAITEYFCTVRAEGGVVDREGVTVLADEILKKCVDSDSSSDTSSGDSENTSSRDGDSSVAPPPKKQKKQFQPAVPKPGVDVVQFLTKLGYQQYSQPLAAGGFASMADLSLATQNALKSCGLLEGHGLLLQAEPKKRRALGVVSRSQPPIPADFAVAGEKCLPK